MWSDGYIRYNTEISNIFSAENKLKLQLQVELTLAEVQEELDMIPKGTTDKLREVIDEVSLERVHEIEKEIHHDLMAMVKAFAEKAGDYGEYIHNTATSMDVQDTVMALQLVQARKRLMDRGIKLMDVLSSLTEKYKTTPQLGRTHGQFAVPTTVGFKLANFLYEFILAFERLKQTQVNLSKFSGAIGNYASSMRLDVEEKLLKKLGLKPVLISTQVVTRQVQADFVNSLAIIAGIIERFAKEVRHLQRSEIAEWYEPRVETQVGSSAMPHKRNPHKSERLNGLARILRANTIVTFENIALEHERDITNSSNERLVIPENVVLLDYMLKEMIYLVDGLVVNEKGIMLNLQKASVSKSEQILKLLIDKVGRQGGHELLRKHVEAENYQEAVLNDPEIIKHIDVEQLSSIFEEINTGLSIEKTEQVLDFYKSLNFKSF
jgi:adenylosuccinate lyase